MTSGVDVVVQFGGTHWAGLIGNLFGGAAKFAGFSLASPTMLGVTARSAVNHCGVPNTSLLSNELQLEYARSQIIHSSQFTKFNSAHG